VSIVEKTKNIKIKEILKTRTHEAIEKGIFGVPTMIVEDLLFWGNDDLQYLELFLNNKDPLDENLASEILNRKRAADRTSLLDKK